MIMKEKLGNFLNRSVEVGSRAKLFQELVEWVVSNDIAGDFVLDSWLIHKDGLNHINALNRKYIGDLTLEETDFVNEKVLRVGELTIGLDAVDWNLYRTDSWRQGYLTMGIYICGIDHDVYGVVAWGKGADGISQKLLITNRTRYEVPQILSAYNYSWAGPSQPRLGSDRSMRQGQIAVEAVGHSMSVLSSEGCET